MEIGLFLNTQFPEGDNLAPRIAEMAMQVRTARDVGFASVLFPHHYLTAPLQMFQITPLMAYLLREAEGMIVAPGILILPLLNPVHVAEEAATFDLLSNGRFVLGVGLGYREPEFTALGIKLSERASRFSESIGLMRRLWAEKRVTSSGPAFFGRRLGTQRAARARRNSYLGRGAGRSGDPPGGTARRRLADRSVHNRGGSSRADARLSRGAGRGGPHRERFSDRAGMLRRQQPPDRA